MTYIVFTDLDGTLLDHETYDYQAALPGLALLKKARIPVVFCSSKTRSEQEVLRKQLGISAPFIVEDGGAVYIEEGYFKEPVTHLRTQDGFQVLEFGRPYKEIRKRLADVSRSLDLFLRGYGDASKEEIADITGLPVDDAARAKKREYEETIITPLSHQDAQRLKGALSPLGLTLSRGGRFYSVKGQNNKGQAAMAVARLFGSRHGKVVTVGIGDSGNDLPLLAMAYIPILVQRPDSKWHSLPIKGVIRMEGIGPVGWTKAVKALLSGKLYE